MEDLRPRRHEYAVVAAAADRLILLDAPAAQRWRGD
jgi:hypothetical protein